eukprot:CAMPEP_0197434254 /NCGR_PEP_ID=MMETSP1175-20131217/2006_1 /TAXON_ID=1003142 /ORGANISM="Triceratium dubium, Strain CCMP147" /LENGTH=405 /DNA_ID=CAMNT_0042962897 /DNA_START=744 /DNA_END=1961 /DNA_ORIENTATION=-
MNSSMFSERSALASWDPFLAFVDHWEEKTKSFRSDGEPYSDLCFGQPQEKPLAALTETMGRVIGAPQDSDTFAYRMKIAEVQEAIVRNLQQSRGLTVDAEDVFTTNGALSALTLTMTILANPGEAAVLVSPIYFVYRQQLELMGIEPVVIPTTQDFDLDVAAIRRAITDSTRFILINSPNNPSGKIYSMETLQKLTGMLNEVNEGRPDRPIFVISDEAYNRIVFDGIDFHSITEIYPYTIMIYTWAKTLLCPGERFGYIALPHIMPREVRTRLRDIITRCQIAGWSKPNNTTALTYMHAERDGMRTDLTVLQRRRDKLHLCLTAQGWTVFKPSGTFYMLVEVDKTMFLSAEDFVDALAAERVLVMPGFIMEIKDHVRMSLTANDAMVDFAIKAFAKLRKKEAPAA